MVAGHEALGLAVVDHAGSLVRARDAADVVLAADRAVEVAARDGAHVRADNGADLRERTGGIHRTADVQILHRTAGLDIAEQTHVRAVTGQRQAADRMPLAVERAAEGRDRDIVHLGEVDVRVQQDGLVAGIGIVLAGFAQLEQILRVADTDGRGV